MVHSDGNGNGFVEQGESYDCGASNCDGIDSIMLWW